MKEKIALVTGATDGIGKETALGILRAGAKRVVIVGRDPAKTASVVASMSADFGSQRVEGLTADLSRMVEVRMVAICSPKRSTARCGSMRGQKTSEDLITTAG